MSQIHISRFTMSGIGNNYVEINNESPSNVFYLSKEQEKERLGRNEIFLPEAIINHLDQIVSSFLKKRFRGKWRRQSTRGLS